MAAARHTLAQRSAELTISGTVVAAGHTVRLTGTGQADLRAGRFRITMRVGVAGRQLIMRELIWGGHFYMGVDQAGRPMRQQVGADWAELPVSLQGAGSQNLVQSIAVLERRGAKVRSLGNATVNGHQAIGYAVTPTKAAMVASARRSLTGLSASERADLMRTVEQTPPPTVDIWVDRSSKLLLRMKTAMSLGGLASGTSGSVIVDVTRYGVPVHITRPAARDVVSYRRLAEVFGH